MIIDIIPCVVVASLETDANKAIVEYFDMLKLRRKPSVRSKKKGTQGAVVFLRRKKFQGRVSQDSDPMNSILREVGELGLNAWAGHTINS